MFATATTTQALVADAARRGLAVTTNEPLARHTTFRVGGSADLFAEAADVDTLDALAQLAWEHGVPLLVLGGGSNLLVSDAGVRGFVLLNRARGIREEQANTTGIPTAQIVAESGAALAGLARWAIRAGWAGLEWAVSVPGTVGGAVVGNAGAHGGDMAGNLAWCEVALPGGGRAVWPVSALGYAYRSSVLKRAQAADGPAPVVLRAGFGLTPGDPAALTAIADAFLARRRATQPVEPSAGSIFRNPPGEHAGRLVEATGLKGHRIGGAMISPRHANFIVNDAGAATAADVLALIRLMQARVREQTGIALAPEILFVGEWT
jgi:UDP-N-acetylmuramate dehydrogenase